MKFHHILAGFLLAFTLTACNFSLAEDITPPPGAVLTPISSPAPTATEIVASVASTVSEEQATGSPTPGITGTASPTGNITISGKVTNGSGGSLPPGLTASLHGILNQQETLTLSMPLNQDGSYTFQNVVLTSGMEFLVAVQYGPVSFLSSGGTYDGKTSSYDQPVTIYDSSSDLTSLSLDQVHIQATFSTAGQIQLDEIYVMTNPGKKAVTVATDGTTLPFASVPAGAIQPSISLSQGSAQLVMADTGFAMLPGTQQYAFVVSYSLDYSKDKASISQPFILSPASVTVIVPVGVKVSGAGLADQGASDFQGSSYQIYSAGPLDAGTALGLTFSGRQQTAAAGSSSPVNNPYLLAVMGFVGLLLVAAGVLLFLRDRRRAMLIGQGEAIKPEIIDDETAQLADAILTLDDRFADGKIDQETYQQQRAELKEKLKSRL
jgi:uncharacterized membrane protein